MEETINIYKQYAAMQRNKSVSYLFSNFLIEGVNLLESNFLNRT